MEGFTFRFYFDILNRTKKLIKGGMYMKSPIKLSFGEEVANAVTHLVPAIAVLVCMPIVSIIAYTYGTIMDVVAVTIFCISLFFMFFVSTLYHCMPHDTPHKDVFHILDHIFIYVAIAGSYTPVALSVIKGWQAWVIIGIQWAMDCYIFLSFINEKSQPSTIIANSGGWHFIFNRCYFLCKKRF